MSPPQHTSPIARVKTSPHAAEFIPGSQAVPRIHHQAPLQGVPSGNVVLEQQPAVPVSSPLKEPRPPPRETPCRYYIQGHCTRGDKCWYKHDPADGRQNAEATSELPQEEKEICAICFEVPETYGLMTGCDHTFCLSTLPESQTRASHRADKALVCIRSWRSTAQTHSEDDYNNRNDDNANSAKKCPLCRVKTCFIIPSPVFPTPPKDGRPNIRKAEIESVYRARLSKIPCKYFEASLEVTKHPGGEHSRGFPIPWCPFGNDCHYRHVRANGIPHVFTRAEINRHIWHKKWYGKTRLVPGPSPGPTDQPRGAEDQPPNWVIEFSDNEFYDDYEDDVDYGDGFVLDYEDDVDYGDGFVLDYEDDVDYGDGFVLDYEDEEFDDEIGQTYHEIYYL